MVMLLIRQVNLDIFWSREASTVRNTLANVLTSANIRSSLRMPMENIMKGPWPVEDAYGFATAITILLWIPERMLLLISSLTLSGS